MLFFYSADVGHKQSILLSLAVSTLQLSIHKLAASFYCCSDIETK